VSEADPLAPLVAALQDVMEWLRVEQVRGLVIGGVAASLLGRPRLTADVDVLVLVEQVRWPALLAAGAAFGFLSRVEDAIAFALRTRVLPVRHQPSMIDVDVVFGALPFEEEMLARAQEKVIGSVRIFVPTPEDLLVMKLVAHRPQDLIDAESVLEAQTSLDLRRIRRWLREFGIVLDRPELLQEFEAILARLRGK
jgi:hypothetical protein